LRVKQLLIASTLLWCSAIAFAQSARTDRVAIENGKTVFLRVGCYTCHGTVGHGGAAPKLAPNTLPLPGFTTWVRNGTPGWTVASGMPAFSPNVISDADLADIRAYLASLPPPSAVNEIPLLAP
jgi:ubiquinol-cytochrome c reductase cytochrome c subunit